MKRQIKLALLGLAIGGGLNAGGEIQAEGSDQMRSVGWSGAVLEWWSDSQAQPLDDSYTFALGTFGSEFKPEAGNMAEWAQNWNTLDVSDYNAEYGFFASTFDIRHDYTSDGEGATPSAVFTVGEQAYLWVYRTSQELTANADEWALISNESWQVPETDDPIALPLTWVMSFEEQQAVIGMPGVTMEVKHDPLTAEGEVGQPLTLTTTLTVPVPEPGGGVLLLMALLIGSGMRRRGHGHGTGSEGPENRVQPSRSHHGHGVGSF
jgi:hypothetical protein